MRETTAASFSPSKSLEKPPAKMYGTWKEYVVSSCKAVASYPSPVGVHTDHKVESKISE